MKAAPSSDKTPRASTRARRPGYVLAAVQSDLSGMAATGHIEISHMSWRKNYVCRKSPECSRRCDEGSGRADEFLLFMGEFLAHSWSISSCARGSILLLLIINWRLNFRLMVAAFIAEREKKKLEFCLVSHRMAQMRFMEMKTRGSRCSERHTAESRRLIYARRDVRVTKWYAVPR